MAVNYNQFGNIFNQGIADDPQGSGGSGYLSDAGASFRGYWHDLGSPVNSGREGKFNSIGSAFGVNLAGYNQDITSAQNIWKGKANSEDWGGLIGSVAGHWVGGSQGGDIGRSAGRTIFPAIGNLF